MAKFKIEEPMTEEQVAYLSAVYDDEDTALTEEATDTADFAVLAVTETHSEAITKARALIDRDTIWPVTPEKTCDYCGADYKKEKIIPQNFFCPVCGQRNQYIPKKSFNYNLTLEHDGTLSFLAVLNKDNTTRCRIYDTKSINLFIKEDHDPLNKAIKFLLKQPIAKRDLQAITHEDPTTKAVFFDIHYCGFHVWHEVCAESAFVENLITERINIIYRSLIIPMSRL